ncbi:hypothetical protein [Paenibacillus senegalimassiliensis]|uniref:hypothetical protein n=1 Tax=Paenibacillus senegalimassiliensis TaxID=1737426 RepID=UPI00073F8C96|nr:hypothetical protein [Paenibacillus senegalimassiliensis]
MSRLLFWDGGQGVAAEIATACAIMLGLHYPKRVLLLNQGRVSSGPEEGLRQSILRHQAGRADESLAEFGVDALLRMAASGRLKPENFADYTLPLLRGRLDLAGGLQHGGLALGGESDREVTAMLQMAEQTYDLVVMHLQGRRRLSEALRSRHEGDIMIAVLPQRRAQLELFFADVAPYLVRQHPGICVVISSFDANSHWNLANIQRRYKSSLPIFGIPHHSEFSDTWNDQDILSFFRKYKWVPKPKNAHQQLLDQFYRLGGKLLKLAEVKAHNGSRQEKGA